MPVLEINPWECNQNAFLVNVIESLAHPFMVVDVTDYTIKIANTAARRHGSADATTCYRLNHGLDIPCHEKGLRCALQAVVETRQPVCLEHFHLDSAGNPSEFEVHALETSMKNVLIVDDEKSLIETAHKEKIDAPDHGRRTAEG